VFYNYKQISNYQGCFLYSHNSWLGNKIIKKQNNNWQFINYGSDTLTIKPSAAIDVKWYAGSLFTANDSARVDSIYSTTFLGVTDSVKSITIYWYYSNQYNSSQILVSKNYGLIKFLNLNENNNISAIIGIKNPTLGVQNLSSSNVFDFQVGDVYHTVYDNGYPSSNNQFYDYKRYVQHNIVSVQNSSTGLTVVDSIYRITKTINAYFNTNPFTVSRILIDTTIIDTTVYTIQYLAQFDKLSFENFKDSSNCSGQFCNAVNAYLQGVTNVFKTKTTIDYDGSPSFINTNSNCLNQLIQDGYPYHFYAYKMGGDYYYSIPNWGVGVNSFYPVYHKRGSVEVGAPIEFLSILLDTKNLENNNFKVSVSPNPAKDFVKFNTYKLYSSITIFNLSGIHLISTISSKVNVELLSSGIYFYTINYIYVSLQQGKFVKE